MSGRPLDPRGRRGTYDPEMGGRPKLDSVVSMANHHYKMKGAGLKPETVIKPTIRIANIPKELEIPRGNLKFLGQLLGKGNFGKVEKAILVKEDRTEHVVAVKMIKGINCAFITGAMQALLICQNGCQFRLKVFNLHCGSSKLITPRIIKKGRICCFLYIGICLKTISITRNINIFVDNFLMNIRKG